jgi:hypothetical protein
VLLVLKVRSTAAENELPWPPSIGSQFVMPGGPPTPDLVGPDAPERAPVVGVFRYHLTLNGAAIKDFDELEDKLVTLHNHYRLLSPSEDPTEAALIEADAGTPIARLASVLRAVRRVSYRRLPMFVFTRTKTHVRPVFGKLEWVVATGARFRLAYTDHRDDDDDDYDYDEYVGDWKNAVPLRLQDFADYDELARRLVDLRRAGKPVLIKIDRSAG